MDKFKIALFASVLSVVLTTALYKPVSIAVFHLTEPVFKCPIELNSGEKIAVRKDAGGDGDFGSKRRNGQLHSGIDIRAPIGTPVRASKSGLAFCLNVPTGYGKYILIYHPDGMLTIYGHLSKWNIGSATQVRQGSIIGLTGKTGNAEAQCIEPHLHFEIRKDNLPQDPLNLMR